MRRNRYLSNETDRQAGKGFGRFVWAYLSMLIERKRERKKREREVRDVEEKRRDRGREREREGGAHVRPMS
jgi:hypothetical protein